MSRRDDRLGAGARLEEFAAPDYLAGFGTLAGLRLPRPIFTLRMLVLFSVLLVVCFLLFVPWVQNAPGDGRITALDPAQRQQTITSLASGRIARWYVRDGSYMRAGEPILDIVDLDPQLLERLEAERRAVRGAYEAAREATRTAQLNLERQRRLLEQGLTSQVAFEQAQIRYQELLARESEAEAALNQVQISFSRQSTQQVMAPSNGTIIGIRAGDTATLINAGDVIAEFAPEVAQPAVELYVSGLDASLVAPGRKARVMFDGWPAVQFGGWPEIAIGTFGGVVTQVDPVVSANGRFRVLITPDPDDQAWPTRRYLRLGAKVRGWIMLDQVRVGYELWRRVNGFPPEHSNPDAMLRSR